MVVVVVQRAPASDQPQSILTFVDYKQKLTSGSVARVIKMSDFSVPTLTKFMSMGGGIMRGEEHQLVGDFIIILVLGHSAMGVGITNPSRSWFPSNSLFFSEVRAKRRPRSLGVRAEGESATGESALTGPPLIGNTMRIGSLVMGVGAGTLGYAVMGVGQLDVDLDGRMW